MGVLHAEDKLREQANQMVLQSHEVSVEPAGQRPPYEEVAHFTFYNLAQGDKHGTYKMVWADRDNFLSEIRFDPYQMLVVKKGGKFYRHENATFTPVRVMQLQRLFPPFAIRFDDTDVIHRIKSRNIGPVAAHCIEFDTVRGTHKLSHEICFAKDDETILSFRDDELEYFWSGYTTFHGKRLPEHAELKEKNAKIIDLDLKYMAAETLSPASIVVPAGLKVDNVCNAKTPPMLKSAPDPTFPQNVQRYNGSVVLAVLIGKDGSVQDSRVIQTMGNEYDREAQIAVKRWKFAPAQCNGQPDEAKINIEVNFKTR